MPLPRLLVIVFACSSLDLAFAEDQPHQTEKAPAMVTKPDLTDPFTGEQSGSLYRFWRSGPSRRASILNPDADATCYTMRTYVVQRDDRQSDSVHPVRYTTCQSAPRFEVKGTTQPVEDKSDRK